MYNGHSRILICFSFREKRGGKTRLWHKNGGFNVKNLKRILTTLAVAVLLMSAFLSAAFANEISVTINGVRVAFPEGQGAVIVDGRTLVPVRGVFEALGFEVTWHDGSRSATITNDDYEVFIMVGNDVFITNGIPYTLDVSAQIINGRTMLPIRAVMESVGYSVGWNAETRTVEISL
jgi:hypothetical protein